MSSDNADGGGKTAESKTAGMEKTFMTSLQNRGADAAALAASVHEPEAMGRVKDLHGKIGSVVSHLNEKIALVLQKQEKEFLAAYRAHMLSVQKELQQLRAKANEAELAMKKNEKIRSLEDERNWYRKEALRLDKFATAMKKDLKYMKEKLESIEDDRKWLERQLKSSKKSNKLLRAELEIRMMQGDAAAAGGGDEAGDFGMTGGSMASGYGEGSLAGGGSGVGGGDGDAGGRTGAAEREPMFPPPHGNRGPMLHTSASGAGSGAGAGAPPGDASVRRNRSRRKLGSSLRSTGDLRASYSLDADLSSAQYRALVERLEAQLTAEKRLVKQLRAHAVATSSQRSELESFFVKCIADVKKDVSRRRTKATQRSSKTRPGAGPRAPVAPSPATMAAARFDKDFGADPVATRAQSPGLDDFTATDRRKVIRRLLSDDYVLQMLHQMIFGPSDEPDLTGGPPENAGATFTGPADGGRGTGAAEAGTAPHGGMALDPAVEDYLYGGPGQ